MAEKLMLKKLMKDGIKDIKKLKKNKKKNAADLEKSRQYFHNIIDVLWADDIHQDGIDFVISFLEAMTLVADQYEKLGMKVVDRMTELMAAQEEAKKAAETK